MVHANDRFVRLVRRFGGAGSDATLEPGTKSFEVDHIEGFVGYRQVARCAIVFGDPICHKADMKALSHEFDKFVKNEKLKAIYIASTKNFTNIAMDHVVNAAIQFGEELIFDPEINPRDRTGPHACLVRRKIKRAKKDGITAHEYTEDDPTFEKAMVDAGKAWKANRRGRQVHISDFYLFENRHGKRWFYAKKEGRIVGGVSLNKIDAYDGYLLNHLYALPEAAKGTSELLLTTVLDVLKEEGCRHATIGYVPGSEINTIVGLGKVTTFLAKKIYLWAKKTFGLDRLTTFWMKFNPSSEPVYILFDRKQMSVTDLLSLRKTLNADKK
jgi:lysylphosphatidylglycerol synthetase-like protein (DUF2156 family)